MLAPCSGTGWLAAGFAPAGREVRGLVFALEFGGSTRLLTLSVRRTRACSFLRMCGSRMSRRIVWLGQRGADHLPQEVITARGVC
jgi:hypothetical protein